MTFALAPSPAGPWKILAGAFVTYFLFSFILILKLFRVIVLLEPWRLTLGRKMAFLFLWGVAFPIGAAASIALLFLQEKRGDVLEENRKSAFQILDQIDKSVFILIVKSFERKD